MSQDRGDTPPGEVVDLFDEGQQLDEVLVEIEALVPGMPRPGATRVARLRAVLLVVRTFQRGIETQSRDLAEARDEIQRLRAAKGGAR